MHRVMKLLFIRHAQSTGNREKRMQGHGDYALSQRRQTASGETRP